MNRLIIEWTTLETSLGAIARLRSFSQDTPIEEDKGRINDVPAKWPSRGEIVFENAVASYGPDLPPAFSDINFTILPGSRFGICGRTGSGKSSLFNSLFRLLDLTSGRILIDGVPHTQIPLEVLRSHIIALPQQPYLLPGSIRRNMDPEGLAENSEIKMALEKVGLWDIVTSPSAPDSSTLANSGETRIRLDQPLLSDALSPGQCQLFVLARALLLTAGPKILVLDEATSNLDVENDALMQRLIRTEFVDKGCTVVAIAHRLDNIADFDTVVVMEGGHVAEIGVPDDLIKRETGKFRAMLCGQRGGGVN